ncbi:MAG: rod shape-determining protein RodA [Candidatus Saganbacteria bacterium]|nr:rod shape-determining protein RodA [Candidatus Saganbacteria bacterium]
MINLRMLKLSDLWLWGVTGALLLIGLFAIFSCTYAMQAKQGLDSLLYVKRQLFSFLVGAGGLIIFAYLDYKHLRKMAPFLYIGMVILLVGILFSGGGAGGAQRWFQIGAFSFQPSELSKIIMVIALATYFTARTKIRKFWDALFLLGLVGIPFLLIFKQPDLGTALVFVFILIGMLAASDSSPKLLILLITPMLSIVVRPFLYVWIVYLLIIALTLFLTRASVWDWILILGLNIAVGIAMPYIWEMLKGYQRQRIIAFLNPGLDPYGAGYHSMQSKIAIGSGGVFGKGFLRGTQTQLQFIPEQHSDFIFSAIGEEFGLIGTSVLLFLYSVFVWRAVIIAGEAIDLFGKFLASGIAVMMAFHVFANIGMTLGLLPVVGMPLPFVSFGGSSLLMNMISVGILQSISMRRQKIIF